MHSPGSSLLNSMLIAASPGMMFPLSAVASAITHHDFSSEVLGREYPYTIYLPDGYESNTLEYPTLYLLHGSFGSEVEGVAGFAS